MVEQEVAEDLAAGAHAKERAEPEDEGGGMFGPENAIFNADGLLVPPRYLASYIASAHIGVIQEWLNGGAVEPPEDIARIISGMTIKGPLFAAGIRQKPDA